MRYEILTTVSLFNLESAVNEYISKGWTPQGGLFIYNGSYSQAMIKELHD
ncbi:MAG: DUF1737 domain-containing protein [Alteromonadales bacterium]|nr:DUF1737 domain-containing protein [Alteromonadales bacterium]